ncbi:hypothetical protein RSP03_44500 [Cereibacter sphaeroides]|nr:hypothetical protein RSP03_44500 [Cereibacter sphaeroides]
MTTALTEGDQQRSAAAQRSIVGGPVRRAVTGGLGLAHANRLTAWIRDVNPLQIEFCNNAATSQKKSWDPSGLSR